MGLRLNADGGTPGLIGQQLTAEREVVEGAVAVNPLESHHIGMSGQLVNPLLDGLAVFHGRSDVVRNQHVESIDRLNRRKGIECGLAGYFRSDLRGASSYRRGEDQECDDYEGLRVHQFVSQNHGQSSRYIILGIQLLIRLRGGEVTRAGGGTSPLTIKPDEHW